MQENCKKNATLRMGYTRIEPLPGGRLAFAALRRGIWGQGHDAKTGDGRGRTNVRSQRADSEGLNRLCPSPQEAKENNKKANKFAYVKKKQYLCSRKGLDIKNNAI